MLWNNGYDIELIQSMYTIMTLGKMFSQMEYLDRGCLSGSKREEKFELKIRNCAKQRIENVICVTQGSMLTFSFNGTT